jgi:hypothetical protein
MKDIAPTTKGLKFLALLMLASLACAQDRLKPQDTAQHHGIPMSHEMPGANADGGEQAMHSMESRHLDMGSHMKMTTLRALAPGDEQRANEIVQAAREVARQYQDYKTALADGYQIFLPNVPQRQYHFTNYRNAFEAAFRFNPEHPTSLLYEKHGADYKLIGVMYTAAKDATEDELDGRIPLSIAQWHAHVNLCVPSKDRRREMLGLRPKFGLAGSIATQEECAAAGGTFVPQIFGWMVHVYPFEQAAENVWSIERQMRGHHH